MALLLNSQFGSLGEGFFGGLAWSVVLYCVSVVVVSDGIFLSAACELLYTQPVYSSILNVHMPTAQQLLGMITSIYSCPTTEVLLWGVGHIQGGEGGPQDSDWF